MKFAPGTPQSVIKAAEQAYMNRPKIDKTAPVQPIMPPKPSPINQRNYDRLTEMAQKGPLGQTSQRNLDYATKRLGMDNKLQMPANVKPPIGPEIIGIGNKNAVNQQPLPANLTGNFQGDTSVPNMNTIGAPAPTGGMMPAGGGGMAAPGTSNMPNAAPPPGFTFKKGGKVKKMASGGMTSKSSSSPSASRRGDGIAQRGKTRGKIC
jgi:hypothetical protein